MLLVLRLNLVIIKEDILNKEQSSINIQMDLFLVHHGTMDGKYLVQKHLLDLKYLEISLLKEDLVLIITIQVTLLMLVVMQDLLLVHI